MTVPPHGQCVVDATWVVDCLFGVPELRTAAAGVRQGGTQAISLALWRFEVGNVLRQEVKASRVTALAAQALLRRAEAFVSQTALVIDTGAVLETAEASGLRTFYDASYVWLARARGLVLYTRDEEILLKCPDVARRYYPV